ncbi:hypothetical protein NQ317_000416 [Molorchus minor]|uniref:C2H2-type domain-containing protein n=1 Tax=Molorchus minor TaxID=1323400 RepID=A0ABQ9JVV7_9CUCU|nr:hypothetical protein NQ317_000416 [Molorchus minor]
MYNQTTVDCVLCGKREIHRNDWNDHIRGHRHESKLKTQNVEQLEKDEANNVSCICCNRNFTDPSFYRIHLGTKTHRRNMKRLDGKTYIIFFRDVIDIVQTDSVPITPTVSRLVKKGRKLGINEGDGLPEIIRKKYKTRNVKTDDLEYKGYIYTLAAFLSMRLALNQKVVDFMISVNDKDWGAFGDVVIRVIRKDRTILYAIQCKKFNQSVKQINCIEETKLNIKKQYDYIATLKNNGKDYSLTKFVIFTAYSTSSNFRKTFTLSSEVLNKWKTNTDTDTNTDTYIDNDGTVELKPLTTKNDVNVTSDPENVFCFVLADKVKCQLPYVFLYTGQKVFPFMINQLLKSKFDNNPDISKDYLKYVEQWGDGKLGGNYKLRKADVILKVGEILLNPFVVSPKKIQSQHDCFDIWNSVVDAVDLTVVKNNKFIISKICQPLNKKIEDTLSTNIDSVTKSVNLNPGGVSILNTISEPIKSYLFEVVQDKPHTEIPLHLIYNVFWKAEKNTFVVKYRRSGGM